jgi:hypothetical protein
MRLTASSVRRIASEMFDARRLQRFTVPSCVADEESVARYEHRDLHWLHNAELHYELVEAGAALRSLPRSALVAREWWSARACAVMAELRRRKRAA